MRAIADALKPEAAGGKARTLMTEKVRELVLKFEARDSTVLRAIMSSYLRMIRAALNASNALLDQERASSKPCSGKD
jgi:tRNA threonylcarbamoyladenosine modification (KEOPS) complex  Pcc1 subunit